MSLEKKINTDIKEAMRAKDSKKLDALRAIKASLLLVKTGKDVSDGEIPESVELSILQKLVKQRKESAELYKNQNRPDLVDDEIFQAGVIEKYLPKQMSEEEMEKGVQAIIESTGANSMKDIGKVMGMASKQFAGKADNKLVAQIVKKLLSA